ncbi:FAD/FMN-containing dehydrogenase [Methanosarcina sp. MTP4]|uniref:FAD-binding oxidoreductase n=1 Tax=Methanosarcina sp. MTP4 TaxID=1434100 RepID=UPI0006156E46|nr:FAD-binding oxidoreductase [Methanosarcina sp. MTP4]AKB23495.1 FAD/FMN-containing dehydrogenase [Methanosarcina sp. MTP4]
MNITEELLEIVGDRLSVSSSELYCYSSDASQVKGVPDYVVRPESTEEVSRIVKLAFEHEIPVTARGAGTGLAGGAVPVHGGIVLDLSGMNRLLEIDLDNLQVVVEPGVIQDTLNDVLKPHGFFFPPNPGSSAMCTIGGMIAYNASGMRCVKYGTTRNYVRDLEVVLADGSVIHTGSKMLKSAAGYDLTQLMIGSEGTLGIVTKAGLKIAPLPKARKLVIAAFENAELAGKAVIKIFSNGVVPSACEILDRVSLQVLKRYDPNLVLPAEGDVILFEVDGTETSAREAAEQVMDVCSPLALTIKLAESEKEMADIWAARKLVGAAVSRLDPTKTRIYVGEDVGVPMKQIPKLLRRVQEISEEFDLPAMKYGHIGDGNLHLALFIDVLNQDEWDRLKKAADKVHRTAIELGGTVSSEHGVGAARGMYMEAQWGPAFEVMRTIKKALDPKGILNPGKLGL